MKRERILGFIMIAIGCTFVSLGIILSIQRPDALAVTAIVATSGLAFALFSTATLVTRCSRPPKVVANQLG